MSRIMVVEDDADIRSSFIEVLNDAGHEVVGFENGSLALEYLRRGQLPDLILLDLMMPVMDGYQFRAAQNQDARMSAVPVVIITAHGQGSTESTDLHAAAALRKPVELSTLLNAVDRYARSEAPA